jgi:hypothetical protein
MAHGAPAREHPARPLLDGNDRGFIQHDPFASHADERVSSAKIDGQVRAE